MPWLYLTIAIVSEVVATSALKAAEGFTRLVPSLLVIAGYALAFYFLSLTLRDISVGVAYAVWSGVGIALVSLIGWIIYNQALGAGELAGMGFIIFGVILLNIFFRRRRIDGILRVRGRRRRLQPGVPGEDFSADAEGYRMTQGKHAHLWPGVPLALASAVLFGASAPLSKILLGSLEPQMLAGALYLGAGFGLAALRHAPAARGLVTQEAPLRRSDLPWLGGAIFFGGVLGPLFLMLGLARTEAASGSLLLNLESLSTMGIAWVVFKENVDRRLLLGAFAIVVGAALLSWSGQGVALNQGAALIAAACLAWGIDNNLTRKLSAADPTQIAMIKGLVAGAANIGLALWRGAILPSPAFLGAAGFVGFVGIGLSLAAFILALRHLGAARTGAYFSLAPFIGAALALVILHEPFTARLFASGLLMGLGLWLHLSEDHVHEHEHEGLEHEHSHVHDAHHQHAHDGPVSEPHSHWHRHEPLRHAHPHYPDLHHHHRHA